MPTIRIDETASAIGRYYGWDNWCNWISNLSRKFGNIAFEILPRNVCFAGTRISRSYSYYRRTLPFFIEQQRERSRKPDLEILGVTKQSGKDETTLRLVVLNKGGSTAKECYGLIMLHYSPDEVVETAHYPTMITSDNFTILDGAELCWWKAGNPSLVNIPIIGKQDLEIVKLVNDPRHGETLVFPSDQGWGSLHREQWGDSPKFSNYVPDTFARVSLKAKSYAGSLLVGADDIEPIKRKFTITYDEKAKNIFLELSSFP